MNELSVGYMNLRDRIGEELNSASQSFVKIGYYLRLAQDTHILDGSGYANVNEFAKGEFGLEESQTSRFININKRFSVDGYSDKLQLGFMHYGWAKLSIMLTLPDDIVEEISPEYSKAEIQTIAAEVKAELSPQAPSDLEVRMEDPAAAEQPVYEKAFMSLLHEKPDLFKGVLTARSEDEMKDALIPLGEAIYFVRIEGIGRVMISMNADGATFTAVRTQEKEKISWKELAEGYCDSVTDSGPGDSLSEYWERYYGEDAPEELKPKKEEPEEPAEEKKEEKQEAKSLYKKSIEDSKKKKSRVEPLKKETPKPHILRPEETEEIAPVQTAMPEPEEQPEELSYLDQLWQQIKDYADLIKEADTVEEVRRCIQCMELTCTQIEAENG